PGDHIGRWAIRRDDVGLVGECDDRKPGICAERESVRSILELLHGLVRHENEGHRTDLAAGLEADAESAERIEGRCAPAVARAAGGEHADAALSADDPRGFAVVGDDEYALRLAQQGV